MTAVWSFGALKRVSDLEEHAVLTVTVWHSKPMFCSTTTTTTTCLNTQSKLLNCLQRYHNWIPKRRVRPQVVLPHWPVWSVLKRQLFSLCFVSAHNKLFCLYVRMQGSYPSLGSTENFENCLKMREIVFKGVKKRPFMIPEHPVRSKGRVSQRVRRRLTVAICKSNMEDLEMGNV